VWLEWSFTGPLCRFTLERAAVGSERPSALARDLPGDHRGYLDRTVQAGVEYEYRLTADPPVTAPSAVRVRIPQRWSLAFNAVAGDVAFITLTKYDSDLKRSVSIGHVYRKGDRIGWWAEREGAEPVSVHTIALPGGGAASVDFNCGRTLVSVGPKEVSLTVKRCKPVFSRDGTLIACTRIDEQRPVKTCEILVRREDGGEERVHLPDPKTHVLARDEECRHAPKDPRGSEALTFLGRADELWEQDSAESIRLYRKLMAEHLDWVKALGALTRVQRRAEQED